MARCFVIGNGESLKDTPLDRLIGETTFATGRINLIYPHTEWRPTYYVMAENMETVDEHRTRHDFRDIIGKNGTHSFIQLGLTALTDMVRVWAFTTCDCVLHEEPPKLWHLPQLCSYGSSLHVAMQIACLYDYNEIYLLGCDLDGGHFSEQYGDSKINTEVWRTAHEIAARSCEAKIYNATIGGKLEVYERIDLCQLL